MSADSLALLLKAFRLPTMAGMYERVLQEAEQQGWGYRKFLQHLCEAEAQDRAERKLERLLKQSGLPAGKSLGNLEEAKLPVKVRRVLPSLLDGGFVTRAENVIAMGLPGRGKSHFLAALGRELILRHNTRCCSRRHSSWSSNCWRPNGCWGWRSYCASTTIMTPSFWTNVECPIMWS